MSTTVYSHILTYPLLFRVCKTGIIQYSKTVLDFEEKVKLATIFYNLKDSEAAKNMKLVQYDVLSSDEHERVYTRIFFDEIQSLVADESLQFQYMHFSISPIVSKLIYLKIFNPI